MSISESGIDVSARLTALFKTSLFAEGGTVSKNDLLEAILRSGMEAADCSAAVLSLFDEAVQEIRSTACVYNGVFYWIGGETAPSSGAVWVSKNNKPLVNKGAFGSARLPAGMYKFLYPTENTVAVPLCVDDTCLGVLEVASKNGGGDFTDTDMSLLEIVAGYAARVYRTICMYHLYADTVQYVESRTERIVDSEFCIAVSPAMREKFELCRKLADSEMPVLLTGENGVGKAFFAYQLHITSCRAAHPFIRVDCAEPSPILLEYRICGNHENGVANTCFEQAADGTLFFDEVAALPLHLQKKLVDLFLRHETAKMPRLVASTARNIEELVQKGAFLSELYGRLNVLPLYIPPLRQRPEDISAFAHFFLHQSARQLKKAFTGFSNDAEAALKNGIWAGNIRELRNTVEYGCLKGHPPVVTRDDLFPQSIEMVLGCEAAVDLKSAVDFFKRTYIRSVLEKNHWNQTVSAGVLEIQRTYLSRLMKELNITI